MSQLKVPYKPMEKCKNFFYMHCHWFVWHFRLQRDVAATAAIGVHKVLLTAAATVSQASHRNRDGICLTDKNL